jgi:hypothetical protein
MGRRNAWLLGVAAVLALLRFVVLPWAHAQAEAHEQLQVLTQRLDRSVGVSQNRAAILGARKQFEAASAAARSRFPSPPSAEAFRLDTQRRIGAIVSASGLKMALFDWTLEGKLQDAGLGYGRTRFQIEGPLRDIARVHGELEGSLPFLAVREVQLNLTSAAPGLDDTRATLTIVADLLFLAEAKR